MLKKDEFLHFLKESLRTEERAIPVYTKRLQATFMLADITDTEREKITEVFRILKTESEDHKTIFLKLITEVEKSTKDVF